MADTLKGWTIRKETFSQSGRRNLTGYTLTDPEGDYVMVGGHGHVSPTLPCCGARA